MRIFTRFRWNFVRLRVMQADFPIKNPNARIFPSKHWGFVRSLLSGVLLRPFLSRIGKDGASLRAESFF